MINSMSYIKYEKKPKITVLMSTYNGEQYLRDQIDSILRQKDVLIFLVIRDDGSKDSTVSIINEYINKFDNISLIRGDNIGPARSFFELCKGEFDSQYYAFSDQDDIWDDDKLINGVKKLERIRDTGIPCLYFSNLKLVDSKGNYIGNMHLHVPFYNEFNAFIDTFGTGCTYVFNDSLRLLLNQYEPKNLIMHDSWFFLLAEEFGKVIYDREPHINYRQHSNNVIGGMNNDGVVKRFKVHCNRLLKNSGLEPRRKQAAELVTGYKNRMSKDLLLRATKVADYKDSLSNKISFICDKRYRVRSIKRNLKNAILILLGEL